MSEQNLRLLAKFELDENGEPATYMGKKYKHYRIILFLENVPPNIYSVTYQLHESYKNRVREIPIGIPNFQERIGSYGDYTITVTMQGVSDAQAFATKLSDALKRNYSNETNEKIIRAIEEIESL